MQHDSPKAAEPSKSLPHHVHPLVAWTAIFNFALIFSLAPTVILAQTPTAAMSEGSEAMAMRLPESSKLAYARHVAMAQEGVKPESHDDQKSGDKKKMADSSVESSCVRSCRITKSDCTRAADSDAPTMHVCFQKFTTCMQACGVSLAAGTKGAKFLMSASLKDAEQAYKDATAAARKKRSEALKKAQSDFEADMKAAQAAYKAAKDAAKAAAKEAASSSSTSGSTN